MFCLLVEGECQILVSLKYYWLNINYSVNVLNECLYILINCSLLSKSYYNVLFGTSIQGRHARRRVYLRTFRE